MADRSLKTVIPDEARNKQELLSLGGH